MNTPKILPIMNDDLYRVLAGRTITVLTKDGVPIALRLYTADELLQAHEKVAKEAGMTPSMTREQAENLTRVGIEKEMTRNELIQWLNARRLVAENDKRIATQSENVPAFSLAFGREREIDEFLLMLSTNLITED